MQGSTISEVDMHDYEQLSISVENIGGIQRCDVTISPDVTVLKGRNATNRSSLLRAIADVLGGNPALIKTDADRGEIELKLGHQTFKRVYDQQETGFVTEGEQFTDKREIINLFVRLLEDNPIRRAVERGDDLRDLLFEPVDTDEIERELRQLESERSRIENDIEQIEHNRERLPKLDEQRKDLKQDREKIVTEIEQVKATIEAYEASEAEAKQAEGLLKELDRHQQELQSAESEISRQRSRLEELEQEQTNLSEELDNVTVPQAEIDRVKTKLGTTKNEKRSLDTTISELQQIIRFNENIHDDSGIQILSSTHSTELTAELDPNSMQVQCWTCGSEVERQAIENRIDELRGVVEDYRKDRVEVEAEIRELEQSMKKLEQTAKEKSHLERELDRTTEEVEIREEKLEHAQGKQSQIRDEIEKIGARVEETEELRESDLVDEYKNLSKLEYDRGQIDQQISKVVDEIEELERDEGQLEQFEQKRKENSKRIEGLRTRIDDLEVRAVEQFNEHMDKLLDVLAFENMARVWIERVDIDSAPGSESSFELNIIRKTSDGAVYEDSIETLSESEREVIGLVVALTGYLTHEVYETVPVMLLDSLEAIDAKRIDSLIDYFSEFVPFLIIALLPEDAAALSRDHQLVTSAELNA